jgi:U3 small nucleolar RNA-associated protein 25
MYIAMLSFIGTLRFSFISLLDSFSYLQCQLFNILNSYKDLFYSNCSITNEAEIRSVCMLHALNHVIKNRSRVRKNNTRLSLAAKEGHDLG